MNKLMVIALGGNSLIKEKGEISAEDQREVVQSTCRQIAGLVKKGYDVVITHGNGPQVGFNLLRSEAAREQLPVQPLDVCVAETQGSIGYMIQQALVNEYRDLGIDKDVVTVITQVRVNEDDEAYVKPSKPVGPFYDQEEGQRLADEKGWDMVEDSGRGFRRVVASPQPVEIVERRAIRALVELGFTVIACGGGGIPVTEEKDTASSTESGCRRVPGPGEGNNALVGSAAVIDKDRAASLLAGFLGADTLIIPTAVSNVYLNFRKPEQIELGSLSMDEARQYLEQGHFAAGSMGPKIEAAVSFLEAGGKEAIITMADMIEGATRGNAGTRIYRAGE